MPVAVYSPGRLVVLISVTGWFNPKVNCEMNEQRESYSFAFKIWHEKGSYSWAWTWRQCRSTVYSVTVFLSFSESKSILISPLCPDFSALSTAMDRSRFLRHRPPPSFPFTLQSPPPHRHSTFHVVRFPIRWSVILSPCRKMLTYNFKNIFCLLLPDPLWNSLFRSSSFRSMLCILTLKIYIRIKRQA
jgi:hypothetical protein